MGQTLSEPITEKHTNSGASRRFMYAASAMQGWRISMEDAHTTVPDILLSSSDDPDKQIGFFAVFDGHGGNTVARFSGEQLHARIAQLDHFKRGDYKAAIKHGFLALDDELRANPEFDHDPAGCTAVVALIAENTLYVGNAGDSRAVLATDGKVVPLSFDHKPGNIEEQDRIMAAGGFVEFGRVNGNLALSRAIGDFEFKQNRDLPPEKQIVTADPDINTHPLTSEDEFLVMACDGIWDCVTNEQCVEYIRHLLANSKTLAQICEHLMDACLAPSADMCGVGCDNMTVVMVAFLNGKSEDEWYAWMSNKYAGLKNKPMDFFVSKAITPTAGQETPMPPMLSFPSPNSSGSALTQSPMSTELQPDGNISPTSPTTPNSASSNGNATDSRSSAAEFQ